jgi:Tfp pilus assembly protein PilV
VSPLSSASLVFRRREPRRSARRPATRGFTIAEIAVTAFVLALVIATAVTTLQRAYSQLDTARNNSLAGAILQSEIEQERLFSWTRLTDESYTPAIGQEFLRIPAVAGRFSLTRTVTPLADRNNQMIQVTLTVQWRNYEGRTLSRDYTTYFTQAGLNDFYSAN